ncbi:MAG: GNAT family N-acetyltransferase [Hyphomicrobiales bacterium]|nr:MAG: GNAT family N-acetyltransferase [Hyphomicrobiales bacterium]
MSKIEIRRIGADSAHELAPLIAAYAQEMTRGAPRRPDDFYAEQLLEDRTAELLGAWIGGELIGFAIFFDLPETISGLRAGQIDDLWVTPEARASGAGRRMIESLVTEGQSRGWAHLRWLVSEKNPSAEAIYGDIGEPAPWDSFVIRIDKLAALF